MELVTTTSVFDPVPKCITVKIPASSCFDSSAPPKPLFVVTPTVAGTYPVILLLHGLFFCNYFYSDLLQHISYHGFIAIAPQLYEYYELVASCGPSQIDSAAKVINWLPNGLQSRLPLNVVPDFTKFALSGHSKGGKSAFALALGRSNIPLSLKPSVLIGIDPVAGCCKGCRTLPCILTDEPQSFNFSIPVLVIGTGLGQEKNCWIMPPCAPDGVNHREFFYESKPPCAHFVVKDYGHMDMLDDDLPSGVRGALLGCMYKNGSGPRDPMRRAVGGIVVAFMKYYLNGEDGHFVAIVGDPAISPAELESVEFI